MGNSVLGILWVAVENGQNQSSEGTMDPEVGSKNQGQGGRGGMDSRDSRAPGATEDSDEEGVASKSLDHEGREGVQRKPEPKKLLLEPQLLPTYSDCIGVHAVHPVSHTLLSPGLQCSLLRPFPKLYMCLCQHKGPLNTRERSASLTVREMPVRTPKTPF